MLSNKYSNFETAIFELTMGITGLFKASLGEVRNVKQEKQQYHDALQEIAEISESHFRQLTEATDGFLDYFYAATPVNEIGMMNIGSRPSHRNKQNRSKSSVSSHCVGVRLGTGTPQYTWLVWHWYGTAAVEKAKTWSLEDTTGNV